MNNELMPFVYDDGGRSKYFRAKGVGDCVCRAITIASQRDYKEVYDAIRGIGENPRSGVRTRSAKFKRLMESFGFRWVSCASIGSHEAVHFFKGELPEGRIVCSVARHDVAVVNGEVHDIWDSRFNGFGQPRRIYGYWIYE